MTADQPRSDQIRLGQDFRVELDRQSGVIAGGEGDPGPYPGLELVAQVMAPAVVHGKIVEQQMHREPRAGGGRGRQAEDAVHQIGLPRPVHPDDPGGRPSIGMQPGHIETGRGVAVRPPGHNSCPAAGASPMRQRPRPPYTGRAATAGAPCPVAQPAAGWARRGHPGRFPTGGNWRSSHRSRWPSPADSARTAGAIPASEPGPAYAAPARGAPAARPGARGVP